MEYIHTDDAPRAIGPYSQAVKIENMVYLSGQIGLDPKTGNLVEGFEAQVRRALTNLQAVLRAAGTDFNGVLRSGVYLIDLANFQKLNEIYAEFFGDHKPARSTIGVAQLPKGASVEIDLIAVVGD
jgi:2-iminobutanoate/2-iminopropanoate deaminase